MRKLFTYTGLLVCILISLSSTAKEAVPKRVDAIPKKLVANLLSNNNNALSFIENKGQITDQYNKPRNDIDYKLDAGGMIMFIGNGQIHYQWNQVDNSKAKSQNSKTGDQISNIQHQ